MSERAEVPTIRQLFDLSGKVALVTGGSRGLGREMAEGLAEAGARLVICARRQQWLTPALEDLRGAGYQVELSRAEPVNRHRPAVDVLFQSAAACAGRHAIGVILTGMGKDGAVGMLAMKQAGAWNIAQDQDSCVVYGMPREAVALRAVDEVVPLSEIGARLMSRLCAAGRAA